MNTFSDKLNNYIVELSLPPHLRKECSLFFSFLFKQTNQFSILAIMLWLCTLSVWSLKNSFLCFRQTDRYGWILPPLVHMNTNSLTSAAYAYCYVIITFRSFHEDWEHTKCVGVRVIPLWTEHAYVHKSCTWKYSLSNIMSPAFLSLTVWLRAQS